MKQDDAFGDIISSRNTAMLAKCNEASVYTENIRRCRDNGMLAHAPGSANTHYLKPSLAIPSYISAELIKMVNRADITQKRDGQAYIKSMPKGFWDAPQLTVQAHGYRLVGWPSGLPPKSPSNGWQMTSMAALACMLLDCSISLVPLNQKDQKTSRHRSFHHTTNAVSLATPSSSTLPAQHAVNLSVSKRSHNVIAKTQSETRLKSGDAASKEFAAEKLPQPVRPTSKKRKSVAEKGEESKQATEKKKKRKVEENWDPF